MQETKELNAQQRCICDTLNIRCKHNLQICTCTFCRIKAAPRRTTSAYRRTIHPLLFRAIIETAHTKQRSLPANIRYWSEAFAISYLQMLDALPKYKDTLPRLEQFSIEHKTGTDSFKAKTAKYGEYFWNDGMTKPATQAIADGDSEDLAAGITQKGVQND